MLENALFIFALLLLTYGSAYFSASEIALFSLSSPTLKSYQTSGDAKKRLVAQLLSHPKNLLVTVFIMNTLVNILLQNVASSLFGASSGWWLRVGIPFVITLILGEIAPKYLAMMQNISIALRVAPTIQFFMHLLKPIREFVVTITTPISRALFFFLKKEQPVSKEEMQHVLKTSQEFGVLHADEAELFAGYLTFQDALVKELMRPREEILTYDIEEPLSKILHLFVDQRCTRLPVCRHDLDNVLGIVSADQYFIHRDSIHEPPDLLKILSSPLFVPESTPARVLFRRFHQQNETFALILNEYGVISGMMTKEDLMEEVVGEIADKRDQPPLYTLTGHQAIIANGKLELSAFNEIFGCHLQSLNNMLTIGGWITEQLGHIPKSGTRFEMENLFFHILSAEATRVKSVYVRKKKQRHSS